MKKKASVSTTVDLCDETAEDCSDIVCTYQEDDSFIIDIEQCVEQDNTAFVETENGNRGIANVCSHLTPEVTKKTKKGPSCFNCEGEHQLNECTEPRDNRRISRNRTSFRSFQSAPRIHEQQENGKKAFTPGVVSHALREALGIGENDIPEWIFRMRKKGFIDGYPPAYLKRAVEKSTLDFFGTDDSIPKNEKCGEVIDPKKMIHYYGFNRYDRKLQDPEKFRIPPWDDFITAHQEELDERNKLRERETRNTPSSSKSDPHVFRPPAAKKSRKSIQSVEEGEIVDDSFNADDSVAITNSSYNSENTVTIDDSDDSDDGEDLSALYKNSSKNGTSNGNDGASTLSSAAGPVVTRGTPILMGNTISSEQFNHEVMKPSLESWSHNILPFNHQNVVQETGFYKKMLSIVKGTRKRTSS